MSADAARGQAVEDPRAVGRRGRLRLLMFAAAGGVVVALLVVALVTVGPLADGLERIGIGTAAMGEPATDGDVTFTVIEAECSPSGSDRLCDIRLMVENTGNSTLSIRLWSTSTTDMFILHAGARRYERMWGSWASGSVSGRIGPGLSEELNLLFSVPLDVLPDAIELHASPESAGVVVQLEIELRDAGSASDEADDTPLVSPEPEAARPPFPDPVAGQRVYDEAGILESQIEASLEDMIDATEARSGAEIVIYLQADEILGSNADANRDAARALMRQWGVGRAGFDDGLVILVSFRENRINGQVAIWAGAGFLAAYMSDADLQGLVDDVLVPAFQQQRVGEGLLNALDVIRAAVGRGISADSPTETAALLRCYNSGGVLEVPSGTDLDLRIGWGTKEQEQVLAFLASVETSAAIGGTAIEGANTYWGAPQYAAGDEYPWSVFWHYGAGPLGPGESITVTYQLTLDAPVSDGVVAIPAGDYFDPPITCTITGAR